jgi:hypothetical protein
MNIKNRVSSINYHFLCQHNHVILYAHVRVELDEWLGGCGWWVWPVAAL